MNELIESSLPAFFFDPTFTLQTQRCYQRSHCPVVTASKSRCTSDIEQTKDETTTTAVFFGDFPFIATTNAPFFSFVLFAPTKAPKRALSPG